MCRVSFSIIIIYVSYGIGALCSNPKVTLPLGKIEGYHKISSEGVQYAAFEGVPYANPPIGKLRFQESVLIEPWLGTIKANTVYRCIQYNHYTLPGNDFVIGNEDCLYVNIYTANLNSSSLQDVVIYIHGGAFMFNYGASFGADIIINRNVILVTLNYRLGPLGFLSTEDPVVPGNNGLKDQVIALKFIKKYIKYFGGNPNSITITGMSAGGASTQFHSLSPLSKGLFTRGMSQSGVVLNPWVMVENSLKKAQQLATHVGCPITSTQEMMDCMQKRSAYQIVHAVKHFQPWLYNPFSPFGVVVDKWSPNPMLPEHPYVLLINGQVQDLPWIFSHTESEGLYPAAQFVSDPQHLKDIEEQWNDLMPHILDFDNTLNIDEQKELLQEIRNHYFKGERVTKETFRTLVDVVSDRLFVVDCELAARLQAATIKSPVYYYYFTYRGTYSKSQTLAGNNENYGAAHGDDTGFVLAGNVDTRSTQGDRNMCKLLTDMWVSFMGHSKPQVPSVEWPPVSKNKDDDIQYLVIESPSTLFIKSAKVLGNRRFWEKFPFRENKNCISTVKDEL